MKEVKLEVSRCIHSCRYVLDGDSPLPKHILSRKCGEGHHLIDPNEDRNTGRMASTLGEVLQSLHSKFPEFKSNRLLRLDTEESFAVPILPVSTNSFFRTICRLQGYHMDGVCTVLASLVPILEKRNDMIVKQGVYNCVIIVQRSVFSFPIDISMPNSFLLSQTIREYVKSKDNSEDDSNSIGLYNITQESFMDLSDDIQDCTQPGDILTTCGFTLKNIGQKTKTMNPSLELERIRKNFIDQLDAQRQDQKISPLCLTDDTDEDGTVAHANTKKSKPKLLEKEYVFSVNDGGHSACNGTYRFENYELHAPVYKLHRGNSAVAEESTFYLKRKYMYGKLGWVVLEKKKAQDDPTNLYGVQSSSLLPPTTSTFRCMAGNPPGPQVRCFFVGEEITIDAVTSGPMMSSTRRVKKTKKKKRKTAKYSLVDSHEPGKHGSQDTLPCTDKIDMAGLKDVLKSKKEEALREEIMLLELEHKLKQYFDHLEIRTTNVNIVAKEYLWNEETLFDMIKNKFGVEIRTIPIAPFDPNDKHVRIQAEKNLEAKRRKKRKNACNVSLSSTAGAV